MHATYFAPEDKRSQFNWGPSQNKVMKKKPGSCSEKQNALHCCREQPSCWCLKRTEFIMEPPLSIQSPCSTAQTSPLKQQKCTTKCVLCLKTLHKEKFNPIGLLNDGWSHSHRVVQRAKDKFGWPRYFYILAHCRIAPVEQCTLSNERQVIGTAD